MNNPSAEETSKDLVKSDKPEGFAKLLQNRDFFHIIQNIFAYLDVNDIPKVMQVSKLFRALADNEKIWMYIVAKAYEKASPETKKYYPEFSKNKNFKEILREIKIREKAEQTFQAFPAEIFLNIMYFLEANDIRQFSQVSKFFNQLANDENLYKKLLAKMDLPEKTATKNKGNEAQISYKQRFFSQFFPPLNRVKELQQELRKKFISNNLYRAVLEIPVMDFYWIQSVNLPFGDAKIIPKLKYICRNQGAAEFEKFSQEMSDDSQLYSLSFQDSVDIFTLALNNKKHPKIYDALISYFIKHDRLTQFMDILLQEDNFLGHAYLFIKINRTHGKQCIFDQKPLIHYVIDKCMKEEYTKGDNFFLAQVAQLIIIYDANCVTYKNKKQQPLLVYATELLFLRPPFYPAKYFADIIKCFKPIMELHNLQQIFSVKVDNTDRDIFDIILNRPQNESSDPDSYKAIYFLNYLFDLLVESELKFLCNYSDSQGRTLLKKLIQCITTNNSKLLESLIIDLVKRGGADLNVTDNEGRSLREMAVHYNLRDLINTLGPDLNEAKQPETTSSPTFS